ncbi:unnamed protein product [Rotaria sp. Silwood1]|nr:unnamed protein product [Rotaria sp. Silwood1]
MYADIPITDNIQRIMFEIDIDTRIQNTKAYASIRHLSNFYDENEVLIMLGSIFKIKSVIYNKKEQMWIAHLVMCSEDDFELRDLLKQIKKETKAGVTSVGFLLYRQELHRNLNDHENRVSFGMMAYNFARPSKMEAQHVKAILSNAHKQLRRRQFVQPQDTQTTAGAAQNIWDNESLITVMLDGDPFGFYTNWIKPGNTILQRWRT